MVAAPILPATLEGAVVRRRGKRLIGPVDLTLEAGGITVVMGPNGAGKTTLLRAIHGIERLTQGRIRWAAPDPHRRQGFVFQHSVMLRRSVLDNIAYPLIIEGMRRGPARDRAATAAAEAGLAALQDRDAMLLSGGERQKLAIARARIRAPQLLFLDEPTASLDPRSTADIEAMLRAARDAGTTVILSTHLIGQAKRLADRIVFVQDGCIAEHGGADRFFDAPDSDAATAYLNGELYP